MKITMNNGITFEGTQAEYEEFLAYAERKIAEDEAKEAQAIETIEFEGATYRKVEREAREGDVVMFSEEIANNTTYVTGNKPYKVTLNPKGRTVFNTDGVGTYGVYRDDEEFNRTRETVDVYEPIEQVKYVPQEGDIVVVTANTNNSANKVGDVGIVAPSARNNRIVVNVPGSKNTGDGYTTTKPNEVRKATPAEVEKYEQAVKEASKPKLKAGDFVKITRKCSYYDSDKVYEVHANDAGRLYVIDEVGDAVYGAIRDKEYEILSAEEAKWAKIGRQPYEFKKGDVVRVIHKESSRFAVGTIGVVIRDEIDSCCRPTTEAITTEGGLASYHPRVELLAPVESLFNMHNA